jgi:hypothetical protein
MIIADGIIIYIFIMIIIIIIIIIDIIETAKAVHMANTPKIIRTAYAVPVAVKGLILTTFFTKKILLNHWQYMINKLVYHVIFLENASFARADDQ